MCHQAKLKLNSPKPCQAECAHTVTTKEEFTTEFAPLRHDLVTDVVENPGTTTSIFFKTDDQLT